MNPRPCVVARIEQLSGSVRGDEYLCVSNTNVVEGNLGIVGDTIGHPRRFGGTVDALAAEDRTYDMSSVSSVVVRDVIVTLTKVVVVVEGRVLDDLALGVIGPAIFNDSGARIAEVAVVSVEASVRNGNDLPCSGDAVIIEGPHVASGGVARLDDPLSLLVPQAHHLAVRDDADFRLLRKQGQDGKKAGGGLRGRGLRGDTFEEVLKARHVDHVDMSGREVVVLKGELVDVVPADGRSG
mmetsp:Transcript_10448/g.21105  ORF Transcript_10448/g.21105 Transcript_10448/m.21105 type:complete len:239 (-) Transcript_10448:740-1456(-)